MHGSVKSRINAEDMESTEGVEKKGNVKREERKRTGLNRLRKKSLSSLKSAVMLSLSALSHGDF